jgi:hypothetical protein
MTVDQAVPILRGVVEQRVDVAQEMVDDALDALRLDVEIKLRWRRRRQMRGLVWKNWLDGFIFGVGASALVEIALWLIKI